jgi:phosphomannomutase
MDMINKHMAAIGDKVGKLERPLKVVLDAGNGLSGSYVPAVLEAHRCRRRLPVL